MLKSSIYILILIFLTACKTNLHNLSKIENSLKIENFYSSYLALEYLEYSRSLAAANNKKDSEHFAKKGLAVAKGHEIIPESPLAWGLMPVEMEDAIFSQKRLEVVSNSDTRRILPIQLAHLHFLYDCWISKESKPAFRLGELSRCKVRFYKLLSEIEQYIEDLKKDRRPKTIIAEDEFERFEVLFDFDKYNFNDKANKQVIEALKYIDSLDGNYRVLLAGNADRVAKSLYNESLALKRVESVREYLIKNGVPRDVIDVRSFGENFPDIITKNNIQHQLNRTVGIYVLKGIGNFSSYPVPLVENAVYKKDIEKARIKRGVK